jgi:hypothetical protein
MENLGLIKGDQISYEMPIPTTQFKFQIIIQIYHRRRRRKRQMPLEQSPNNNMPGVLAIMAQKMSASTVAPPAQAYSMAPYAADQQQGSVVKFSFFPCQKYSPIPKKFNN